MPEKILPEVEEGNVGDPLYWERKYARQVRMDESFEQFDIYCKIRILIILGFVV